MSDCILSGTVKGKAGSALINQMVRMRIGGLGLYGGAQYGGSSVFAEPEVVWTDSGGAWTFTVPQGALMRLEIPSADVDHVGYAPSALTADFNSVIGSLQRYRN